MTPYRNGFIEPQVDGDGQVALDKLKVAARVAKYLQDLDLADRNQIIFLTEMLDATVAENARLQEALLRLQNELDREREKKLQSP